MFRNPDGWYDGRVASSPTAESLFVRGIVKSVEVATASRRFAIPVFGKPDLAQCITFHLDGARDFSTVHLPVNREAAALQVPPMLSQHMRLFVCPLDATLLLADAAPVVADRSLFLPATAAPKPRGTWLRIVLPREQFAQLSSGCMFIPQTPC